MNSVIAEKIESFSLGEYQPIFRRELDFGSPLPPKAGNLVTVITGMRRSGKSYRLFQEMDRLQRDGIPTGRMLYFNFEDDRLDPVTPAVGDEAIETFLALHPEAHGGGMYLFLDELQEMAGWGKWLRRIVDTHRATIYVTGSSSKMLSREIATEFRGRSIAYEQTPFSFREYARFHEPGIDPSAPALTRNDRAVLQRLLREYLETGGFPAVQGLPSQTAVQVLQSYLQRVVARDVIERHNLGNPQAIALFARTVVASNGRALSLRKVANDFHSRGISVNRVVLSDVLGYLEDAFLVTTVKERSRALRENDNTRPKVYAIDPGLCCANAPASAADQGQRLEQAVYLELRRRENSGRSNSITSLKTRGHGYEIDFAVGDVLYDDGLALYQVAKSIDDDATRTRETRALWEALSEGGGREATLVVQDGNPESIERDGLRIDVVPAWDWLRQPL